MKKGIILLTMLLMTAVFAASVIKVEVNSTFSHYGYYKGTQDSTWDQDEEQTNGTVLNSINITSLASDPIADINISIQNIGLDTFANSSRDIYIVTNTINPSNIHIPELLSWETQSATWTENTEILNFTVNYTNGYKATGSQNITVNLTIGINSGASSQGIQVQHLKCYFYNVTEDADDGGDDVYDGDADYDATDLYAWPNCAYSNYPGAKATSAIKDINVTHTGQELLWEIGTIDNGAFNWTYFNITTANASASTSVNSTKILCSFMTNTSVSNVTGLTVNATGSRLDFNVTKVLDANSAWVTNASVFNPNNFTLRLVALDLWATTEGTTDPSGSAIISGSYEHNITAGNTTASVPGILYANHMAHSNSTNVFSYASVPVIWVNFSTDINTSEVVYADGGTNMTSYRYDLQTQVIAGYYIYVQKNITNDSANVYNISLLIKNVGAAASPSTVMMFDFVPTPFYRDNVSDAAGVSPRNMTLVYNDSTFYTAEDEGLAGDAWGHSQPADTHESQFSGNNSAPNYLGGGWSAYWKFATLTNTEFAMVRYTIEGTGDYELGNTFVVGVDPIQTSGQGIAANPMNFAEVASVSNMEPLLAFLNFVLVVLVGISIQRRKKRGGK